MGEEEGLVKVLLLAVDPTDVARLRSGQELRDIREVSAGEVVCTAHASPVVHLGRRTTVVFGHAECPRHARALG